MAFCEKCNREAGVVKKSRAAWIIGFLILGLIIPLWIISLPFFWGLALLMALIPRSKMCGICKTAF